MAQKREAIRNRSTAASEATECEESAALRGVYGAAAVL